MLGETLAFGDCGGGGTGEAESDWRTRKCGYATQRWPSGKASDRSPWLTVLTTTMQCEAGMSAVVVCPAMRWLIHTFNGNQSDDLNRAWDLLKLSRDEDEFLLFKAVFFLSLYNCEHYIDHCFPVSSFLIFHLLPW